MQLERQGTAEKAVHSEGFRELRYKWILENSCV